MICNMATSKNISSEYVLPRKTATFFTIALLTGKLKWTIEKKNISGPDVSILIIPLLLTVRSNATISSFT